MDQGTCGFIIGNHYLGSAFTGLRGKKLFLTISAVWGHCEITMIYLGGLEASPLSLSSLCRNQIRKCIKGDNRTKGNIDYKRDIDTLNLPQPLKDYLHF